MNFFYKAILLHPHLSEEGMCLAKKKCRNRGTFPPGKRLQKDKDTFLPLFQHQASIFNENIRQYLLSFVL
jgi:hypothetical protein